MRVIRGRRTKVSVAIACLVMLGLPGASGEGALTATLDSLRSLEMDAEGGVPASVAHGWRAMLDADASGAVGPEEVAVFTDVMEALVRHPEFGSAEAYTVAWDAENGTGARGFTLDGRANLSNFAFGLAPTYRLAATLDGAPGALQRVTLAFGDLVGRVATNASAMVVETLSFVWGPPDGSRQVHRLELSVAPMMELSLRVGGSFEIVGAEQLGSYALNADGTTVEGRTEGGQTAVLLKARAVTSFALLVVGLAVALPALLVGVVTLRTSRAMQVKETPLPVEPRHR